MAAPDGSTTLPLTGAERQVDANRKKANRPVTYFSMSGSSLESRYLRYLLAGLLTCASPNRSAFPFRFRNSGFVGRFSALTVAGLCRIYTGFPYTSGLVLRFRV